VEPLPDLGSLSDAELKGLIEDSQQKERDVSYQRRMLHGKIDILRAELVARLQKSGGRSVLDEVDVEHLTDILTGKGTPHA
jgi:RNA polymerase-interacting CarD/CdnL/TRCF family regulator